MKTKLSLLFTLFSLITLQAQNVGIGTASPDPSAKLHIEDANRGLLIPQVSLVDVTNSTTPVNTPATGLLVWNTNATATGGAGAGFYYWSGSVWVPILGGTTISLLEDLDADTKVQVEESADEDIIRFDMAGTEYFDMNLGRLGVYNTGNSVFIGDDAGTNDDLTGNNNVFVGYRAGRNNTSAQYNTFVGAGSGSSTTTGGLNTFIGSAAGNLNTTGNINTAVGRSALQRNTTGGSNTALGWAALTYNSTGSSNTALGERTLNKNETGIRNTAVGMQSLHENLQSNNVALGFQAGYNNINGSGNILLGYQAGINETGSNLLYIENSNAATPLIWGDFANDSVKVYGTLNVNDAYSFPIVDGTNGQVLTTDGAGAVSWTSLLSTILQDADTDTKVQVEESADEDIIRFDMAGTEYFTMNTGRLSVLNTGNSVFIGQNAGVNDDLSNNANVFTGRNAGQNNTTGQLNVAYGAYALSANVTGSNNVAMGYNAGTSNTGSRNTFVGYHSGRDNAAANENTGFGYRSLEGATGTSNTAIGSHALLRASGNNNTALGYWTLRNNTTGIRNTAVGNTAQQDMVSGTDNVSLGYRSLYNNTDGDNNLAIGSQTLNNNVNGSGNIALGYQAGFNETGDNKLYIENSSSVTPLIWGDFANDSVKVYGTFNVNDAYSFPIVDGTNGQVLTTDGAGAVSWSTLSFTDTDDQTLSLSGTDLSIVDGNTISLATLQDNLGDHTATTNIELNGNWMSMDGDNEGVYVDAAGNVGMGTNTPGFNLEVSGDARSNTNHYFGTAGAYLSGNNQGGSIELGPANSAGAEIPFIDFHFGVGAAQDYNARIINDANNRLNFLTNSGTAMTINATNVGVGITAPSVKFQVGTNGDGTVALANAWNTFSDRRWKTNFEIIPNALGKLNQINGYFYDWKNSEEADRQVGVIAQEIEAILPECVHTNKEGYKSVDYSKLTALLIQVNKEQQAEIERLKAAQQLSNKELSSLHTRLQAIEQLLNPTAKQH